MPVEDQINWHAMLLFGFGLFFVVCLVFDAGWLTGVCGFLFAFWNAVSYWQLAQRIEHDFHSRPH